MVGIEREICEDLLDIVTLRRATILTQVTDMPARQFRQLVEDIAELQEHYVPVGPRAYGFQQHRAVEKMPRGEKVMPVVLSGFLKSPRIVLIEVEKVSPSKS